jgi:hypothetical protein
MKAFRWRWLAGFAVLVLFGCGDDERTIVVTNPTATVAVTPLPTGASTPTGSMTPPPGSTATPAGTAPGPIITHLGISTADDLPVGSSGIDAQGRLIFNRRLGQGLNLIVEARRGTDEAPVGISAYDSGGGLPDLQMLVSRPLGDGSPEVCDVDPDGVNGGVPGVDPPDFSNPGATTAVINDLGCRVNDGTGAALGRSPSSQACTRFSTGDFGFVASDSDVQFCLPIASAWAFPRGDTIVTARLRSARGNLGDPIQIVVRVELESPTPRPQSTATPVGSPIPTPTSVPPLLTHLGIAAADDRILTADDTDSQGRPVFNRLLGHGMSLIIEGTAAPGGRPLGRQAYDFDGNLPDLQVLVSRPLGDGSTEVCDFDIAEEIFGGIPGTDPPAFLDNQSVVDAVNDLGCRVNDGTGLAVGRPVSEACTRNEFGDFTPANPLSTTQFCLPIAKAWEFPSGDTIVAARVRSVDGGLSPSEEIVIRVDSRGEPNCEEEGLGVRPFSIRRPESEFVAAETGDDVSTDPWVGGTWQLCAGRDAGGGVRPLRLLDDVIIGFAAADGTIVCAEFFAEGSSGVLDCGGMLGHDVIHRLSAVSGETDLASGLGDPSGSGAATLAVQVALRSLPAGAEPEECFVRSPLARFDIVFTTATTTAEVTDSSDEMPPMVMASGLNFDCSSWAEEDGAGTLAGGLPLVFGGSPVGDTAIAYVLED